MPTAVLFVQNLAAAQTGVLAGQLSSTLIDNSQCGCDCQLKRIGEDVSEKLDYMPGTFSVERHILGKGGMRAVGNCGFRHLYHIKG